jgi:hypothetical protein
LQNPIPTTKNKWNLSLLSIYGRINRSFFLPKTNTDSELAIILQDMPSQTCSPSIPWRLEEDPRLIFPCHAAFAWLEPIFAVLKDMFYF